MKSDILKEILTMDAQIFIHKSDMEREGIRVLLAFQCIKCGRIHDRMIDITLHKAVCEGGKP